MTSGDAPPAGVTRRTVLGGAAVAGAVALVDPAAAAARAGGSGTGGGPDAAFNREVGAPHARRESAPTPAPRVFSLAGVEWAGSDAARIELRSRSAGGAGSRWVLASVLGHGPD